MTPAPPFDCSVCGRRIGKTRGHVLVGYPDHVSIDRVLCVRCMLSPLHVHRELHARFYPGCPVEWHDLHDHRSCSGTRAGIATVLGLWPARKDTP